MMCFVDFTFRFSYIAGGVRTRTVGHTERRRRHGKSAAGQANPAGRGRPPTVRVRTPPAINENLKVKTTKYIICL